METTFKDRLLVEQKELLEKIVKLKGFIATGAFNAVPEVQQVLLNVQLKAMETYSECLTQRLLLL